MYPTKQFDTSKTEYSYHNLGCPNDVHNNLDAAGGEVFVTGGQEIIATFFNGSAAYNSELFLHQPTEMFFIGQQNHTLDGTQTSLGFFPKGQNLSFPSMFLKQSIPSILDQHPPIQMILFMQESSRQTQIFGTEALKT